MGAGGPQLSGAAASLHAPPPPPECLAMEWSPGTANPITETPATAWRRDPSDSRPYPGPQDPPVLRQYSAPCEPHPSAALLSLFNAAGGGSCDRSQARECIYGLAPFLPPASGGRTEWANFEQRLSAVAPGTPRQESQVPLVEQIDLAKKWLSVTNDSGQDGNHRPPDQCLDVHRTTPIHCRR